LGLVASVVGIVIFVFLKTPGWNFNLGGHFHPLGGWQGKGTLHSATAGGDYAMWIQFEPSQRTMTGSGLTLMGTALLCSPRGEYLPLKTSAQALRRHGNDLIGVPLHVRMNGWVPLAIPGTVRIRGSSFTARSAMTC
jgi:hypothetical protein